MAPVRFTVSKEDWSLHRKGYQDQQRHREKVREAIRKNLPDLITEESIIMTDGRQIVKVPIRSLDEYRFRFNYEKQAHGGTGDGNAKPGDVLGRDGEPAQGPGTGPGAGDQPGIDYYEADVSVEDIEEVLFKDLELPDLKPKDELETEVTDIRFNDVRKKGLSSNIDKKRTILETLKRNAMHGKPGMHHISPDDLRYKTWEEIEEPRSNAVVLAMMDTSGSMGVFEKYVARTFFFWTVRFLRTKYQKVDIVFIAHHTEAKIVSETEFFTKGESGGTICSSAYQLALDLVDHEYPLKRWNIYPIHFSDGDNLSSDNERCVQLVNELMDKCNIFGYGEVNQYQRTSTLMSAYRHIHNPKFRAVLIREKGDVYKALTTFFSPAADQQAS
ncbi:sporulation protein YhbH [Kyrpidia spormannii]|uniref:Factor involved in shape determination n=1 Tax=Kyrpidia spormannii TaxID=2055160 RepID=A0ACA8ZBC1_9BACL|nr:sporulation protein YhbH [Kyrpidia spormannii]CAB3394115.1 factor involved in shape determination [Kyrpidia spormannii]